MKIFFVCSANAVGMATLFVGAGKEVVVCTDGEVSSDLNVNNTEVISSMKQAVLNERDLKRIGAYDFDVVFTPSVDYVAIVNYLAREKGVKSVVQVLDVPLWRLGTEEGRKQWEQIVHYLSQSDIIIANTKITKDILIEMGIPRDKIKLSYWGVDPNMSDKVADQESDDSICCVSRTVFHKAIELGLYAFSMAKVNNRLKLIGPGSEKWRLVQIAWMIGANATLFGYVSETKKIEEIKRSLIGIFPNVCPTIGGVFPLESLACGKPCIVWDTPINHDIYANSVEYVPLFDLKAFSTKIKYLINNPDYRLQRAIKGKEWILKNRTISRYVDKITEVITSEA